MHAPRTHFSLSISLALLAACASSHGKPALSTPSGEDAKPHALDANKTKPDPESEAEATADEAESLQRDFGRFVRFELVSEKPAQAAAFYSKLLGWTVTKLADGDELFSISNHGSELARLRKLDPASAIPAGWMCWISVEDIDDLMRDVPANGGTILQAPSAAEDGRIAVLRGPTGGVFGVIELRASAQIDRSPESGDFVLSQLWTDDFDAARSFYSVMGDYTSDDVTHGTTKYSIMRGEGIPRAVIRLAPKGKTNRWIPFVLTREIETLAKSAAALGATVVTPPRDVPTLGLVAVVEAPGGGVIGFMTPE